MLKSRGRHTKPRLGPLFAFEALRITYAAKHEMEAASASQRS